MQEVDWKEIEYQKYVCSEQYDRDMEALEMQEKNEKKRKKND